MFRTLSKLEIAIYCGQNIFNFYNINTSRHQEIKISQKFILLSSYLFDLKEYKQNLSSLFISEINFFSTVRSFWTSHSWGCTLKDLLIFSYNSIGMTRQWRHEGGILTHPLSSLRPQDSLVSTLLHQGGRVTGKD